MRSLGSSQANFSSSLELPAGRRLHDREAGAPQGRAERAGACDTPLSARPASAVAIPLSFASLGKLGGGGKNGRKRLLQMPMALHAFLLSATSKPRCPRDARAHGDSCGSLRRTFASMAATAFDAPWLSFISSGTSLFTMRRVNAASARRSNLRSRLAPVQKRAARTPSASTMVADKGTRIASQRPASSDQMRAANGMAIGFRRLRQTCNRFEI
jgi:hypothetical protein